MSLLVKLLLGRLVRAIKGKIMKELFLKAIKSKRGKAALVVIIVAILDGVGVAVSPEWQSVIGQVVGLAVEVI